MFYSFQIHPYNGQWGGVQCSVSELVMWPCPRIAVPRGRRQPPRSGDSATLPMAAPAVDILKLWELYYSSYTNCSPYLNVRLSMTDILPWQYGWYLSTTPTWSVNHGVSWSSDNLACKPLRNIIKIDYKMLFNER